MATVTGLTAERMQEIIDATIVSAEIVGGHLILHTSGGDDIDAGSIAGTVPSASTTEAGVVELATSGETSTGTDTTRAVTPAGLKSVTDTMNTTISGKQDSDSDLTAIAALLPTNDDVMQRKSGAWTNRSLSQLKTDLAINNVTNTSDANKPVSTAQQTALDLKANLAGPTFTGTVTISGKLVSPSDALTDGATINTDASTGNYFRVTLGGNRTLAKPTNLSDGQILTFEFIQDATGSRTLTLDSSFAFGTDITSVTLTTTANKRDFLVVRYNSTADKLYVLGFQKGF